MTTESHQSPLGNEGATQAEPKRSALWHRSIASRQNRGLLAATALCGLLLIASACTREADAPPAGAGEPPLKITNRIDVPEVVRNNLGITFVKVERRQIGQTLRVPGVFETPPEAFAEQRSPLAGRVTRHVSQYQAVEVGAPLFGLDAPEWRRVQQELVDADARAHVAEAQVGVRTSMVEEATKEAELLGSRAKSIDDVLAVSLELTAELEQIADTWRTRVSDLEKLVASGVGKTSDLVEAKAQWADAKSKLIEAREKRAELALQRKEFEVDAARVTNSLARLNKELKAANADAKAANEVFAGKLSLAVALTGLSLEELKKEQNGVETWRGLSRIEFRAPVAGVVSEVLTTQGGWVEQGGLVLSLQDTKTVRVRARALQSDLTRLSAGMEALILPPTGGVLANETPIEGKTSFSLTADADERVIDLIVHPNASRHWARPGVAVQVEITLDSTDEAVLAVPVSSVVRDELQRILFRRDPNNADKVIRIAGEFGISDGRWIEIKRDVVEGDEVVLGGVYELKLTGSGKPTGAGHFHADGTWHTGAD